MAQERAIMLDRTTGVERAKLAERNKYDERQTPGLRPCVSNPVTR